MELNNTQRASVLVQALPYIQKYTGKIAVIKYGGNAMINEELKQAVMGDLVLLSLVGVKVVLVHGGGPEITDMLNKVGKETEFINGLRVTDKETADIVNFEAVTNRESPMVYRFQPVCQARIVSGDSPQNDNLPFFPVCGGKSVFFML